MTGEAVRLLRQWRDERSAVLQARKSPSGRSISELPVKGEPTTDSIRNDSWAGADTESHDLAVEVGILGLAAAHIENAVAARSSRLRPVDPEDQAVASFLSGLLMGSLVRFGVDWLTPEDTSGARIAMVGHTMQGREVRVTLEVGRGDERA